jgi:hypothetical protein
MVAARRSRLFWRGVQCRNRFAPHSRKTPPAPSGCARKKGTGGEDARRKRGRSERALTPRDKARSLPPSNIVPAAHADMRDGTRPAPAFSGQKLVTTRHCATTPFDGTKRRLPRGLSHCGAASGRSRMRDAIGGIDSTCRFGRRLISALSQGPSAQPQRRKPC